MKQLSSLAAIGAALTVFAVASPAYADGWERSRTVHGPYSGEHNFRGSGNCNDDSCSSRQEWTGPGGGTITRKGSTSCYDGYCEGSASAVQASIVFRTSSVLSMNL